MLRFDPSDPFPIFPEGGAPSYAEAQAHSAAVDAWLGIDTARVEAGLLAARGGRPLQERWIGLPAQALLTPYTELRVILARLAPAPGATVVDLGAGYGRMGFVLARHHPGARFVGYEVVDERVREGACALTRFGCAGARLERADIAAPCFVPEAADFYFIYDFSHRAAIEKALADLAAIARQRPITVVGRGRGSRDAIERGQPWLSQVVPPEHHGHFSLYRSAR